MLMPGIFGESLLDEFNDFWGFPSRGNAKRLNSNRLMQTDVEETEDGYAVTMDLPGFKKEDVKGELKDGYLIISASTSQNNDEKDKEGRYIRKERYSGSCSRSFYVGDHIKQSDIKARFENGTLKFTVPKEDPAPKAEEQQLIAIEG